MSPFTRNHGRPAGVDTATVRSHAFTFSKTVRTVGCLILLSVVSSPAVKAVLIAEANGPYVVTIGEDFTLSAAGSTAGANIIYNWQLVPYSNIWFDYIVSETEITVPWTVYSYLYETRWSTAPIAGDNGQFLLVVYDQLTGETALEYELFTLVAPSSSVPDAGSTAGLCSFAALAAVIGRIVRRTCPHASVSQAAASPRIQ